MELVVEVWLEVRIAAWAEIPTLETTSATIRIRGVNFLMRMVALPCDRPAQRWTFRVHRPKQGKTQPNWGREHAERPP
jgi:hypothetical protein